MERIPTEKHGLMGEGVLNDIENRMAELYEQLSRHARLYYEEDAPVILDT